MVDFAYLYKGLCALGNAHQAGTMAGHLGASVVTGYFFGEDNGMLPEKVFAGIEAELDRIIAGEEAIWFNAKKAGVTPKQLFQSFPDGPSNPEAIQQIVSSLSKNAGSLRQSGHNVIFAAAAIRALRDHERFATPNIVGGIRKLIQAFDKVSEGRGYFGKAKGWRQGQSIDLKPDQDFPAYESIPMMVELTLKEVIETASIRKQGFGGLWHIINHAAAITELDRFGYREVAKQCLAAHHRHIGLWRTLPDLEAELGPVVKSKHDPKTEVYWEGKLKRDEARLTHRIKTLYGFHTLLKLIEDKNVKAEAEDAFLYLMA